VPDGSKKRTNFNGRADITWQFPVQGMLGTFVWEVKVWSYGMQASAEALWYAACYNLNVGPASAGFDLNSILNIYAANGTQLRVFSYGPGGILYEVQNSPRQRPQPDPTPNPQPKPIRYVNVIVLLLLGAVAVLVVTHWSLRWW
jgi:hypothetical protein